MTTRRPKLALLVMGCLIGLSAWPTEFHVVAPEDVGLSSDRLERLTRAMENGVEEGHFPGAVAAIMRNGKIAYFETYGYRDRDAAAPTERDTIFRMASMTKPITGVAVMILFEEGHFSLNDPVSRFIPSFENVQVAVDKENTVPSNRPITIRDLLRHTSGISYKKTKIYFEGTNLEEMIDWLATIPMIAHPGDSWEYGMSTDVLARLVEVVSGKSFDVFLEERIFNPLEMNDTGFYVPEENHSRLVKMHPFGSKGQSKTGRSSATDTYLSPPAILMGGTGLVSTTMDYLRFCQMLLNDGELDGQRILGRKAVELMHADHLGDIPSTDPKLDGGVKMGLTFGVKGDPGESGELGSEGSYFWAGAFGTSFFIDPNEALIGVFMVNGTGYGEESLAVYGPLFEHFAYQAIVD